jgi:hypothetical protein
MVTDTFITARGSVFLSENGARDGGGGGICRGGFTLKVVKSHKFLRILTCGGD